MMDKPKIGTSATLECHGERSSTTLGTALEFIEGRSRTIGILSLGCPRNLVDSQSILARFNLKKYKIVDMDKADIGIVNTCAFIQDAKIESIDAILELIDLKKAGKLKKIIVYGCLTQRYQDKLRRELPEVDAFVGRISLNHNLKEFSLTPRHYAYLKICEGCINNCSYCIIPKIKGRFTSLDIDSILGKVEILDKRRISELNIIGQDITGYGIDLYKDAKLAELLRKIVKNIINIGWIRLLYLYPSRVTDELLGLIRDEPRICKYIDLPIQHINDRILRLMNRDTTKKDILRLIAKIRKKIPDVAIRTSLIVGFPSEQDEEFQELVKFVQDTQFERLGVFIYSREEDTLAYNLKEQIPKKIKLERFNTIMSLQQRISQEINQRFLGRIIDVLVEERERDYFLGRSQHDAPEVDGLIYINPKDELKPGDFVKVKITDTLEYDLIGEAI
jgi:ribosomal protein S12 methylthiotransferase